MEKLEVPTRVNDRKFISGGGKVVEISRTGRESFFCPCRAIYCSLWAKETCPSF